MRFSKLLVAVAVGTAAAAAAIAAQQSEPVGLESVKGSVDELKDETQPPDAAPTPAEPAEASPAEPAAPQAAAPAAAPAEREAAQGPAPPLTRAELTQLQRLTERGRLLGAIARAGMIATQDMLSRVSDPEGAGINGWLAEPEGNGMAVTFYADTDAGPRAVYRANVLGGRVVSRNVFVAAERPPLGPLQTRMAAARAVAAGQQHRPCGGDQFNYLIVPPAGPQAPIEVYQITPPTQRGRFPMGGHFRTTVAADGSIAETRAFTNACLDIEAPVAAAGQPPRPIGLVHLLDPMPTEIHLLGALLFGRPLLVATGEPQRIWLVTGERISEVR